MSLRRTTGLQRRSPLTSKTENVQAFQNRAKANSTRKRRPLSPASPEQRQAVKGRSCIVCGGTEGIDPAHLIDRSLCPEGADDPRAVIPLDRQCHRLYDEGQLSVLEHLEPYHRAELAYAVERFGLISTLERLTNTRWRPVQ